MKLWIKQSRDKRRLHTAAAYRNASVFADLNLFDILRFLFALFLATRAREKHKQKKLRRR